MHADEIEIDVWLVERLVAAQRPEWAGLPVEPVFPLGTDNANYRLGEELVARLPRISRAAIALEKEVTWLPWLAPQLPLPAPLPAAVGKPGEGFPFPWAIYTWLDGEQATAERLDPGRAASDLAGLVAALEALDPTDGPGPGEHNVHRGEPIRLRDGATRAALAALGDRVDAAAVTQAWEHALSAPDDEGPPVWIHGDLDARNLLAADGRLCGVLDWGCLGVGDPACDVMVAWKMLPAAARETFRVELGVADATWARARGWALSQALMALSYYTEETNAALVVEARRWLDEVLADPSG
jgi:aminoglycoside phosphotransferase (APT) family kinase protein